jgi:flagellar motility protein MotE (MotC chaperone)
MKILKTNYWLITLMVIAALGIAPLCYGETSSEKASIEEIKQETQELIQTLKAYTADQRDEAIKKTKTALENLDRRIDALEARIDNNWDNMNKAAREKARTSLKALRKQRTKVAEWYGSMKSSSAGAWKHMKQGFSDAYNALYQAWEKSEKEFKTGK